MGPYVISRRKRVSLNDINDSEGLVLAFVIGELSREVLSNPDADGKTLMVDVVVTAYLEPSEGKS